MERTEGDMESKWLLPVADGSVETDEEELDDDDNEPETAQAQVAPPGTKVRHLGRNINRNY